MKEESLVENTARMGSYLTKKLGEVNGIKEIRGRGLMLGIEFLPEYATVRNQLLFKSHIFTGGAKNNVMRLLPPLSISESEIDLLIGELKKLTD